MATARTSPETLPVPAFPGNTEPPSAEKSRIQSAYGKLSLYFIRNGGEADKRVMYYERGAGHATSFARDGVYLGLTRLQNGAPSGQTALTETIKLGLLNANSRPKIVAEGRQAGRVNYFLGNDATKWQAGNATYEAVRYRNMYPGVDVRYYGNNSQIEYDVIVQPGADPECVQFQYQGIKGLTVTAAGELDIQLANGNIFQKKPYIYQVIGGKRVEVGGGFQLRRSKDGKYAYGFQVAAYDTTRELVIDPTLVYSTYLGGGGADIGYGIAVDSAGYAYITGVTSSTNFPVVLGSAHPLYAGAVQGMLGGGYDVFVSKLSPMGNALMYSTYLGGTGDEYGLDIAVDAGGNAFITGKSNSSNFPVVLALVNPLYAGAVQGTLGGGYDAFVTKLNPTGTSLMYSTYLGGTGSDLGFGISTDAAGNAYVAGWTDSADFPVTTGVVQGVSGGGADAFVTEVNPTGTAWVYSTYVGGTGNDSAYGIAVDTSGSAYITGQTSSTDFPVTSGVVQGAPVGGADAFASKLNTTATALTYSTYLGGTAADSGSDIAVDASGNAYITGQTASTDFQVTSGVVQGVPGGGGDAFASKLNSTAAALAYSTYLGGSAADSGSGIAVDASGNAYITGQTASTDFQVTSGVVQGVPGGGGDAFLTKLSPDGSALGYSTYFGGGAEDVGNAVAVDAAGSAFTTGYTLSANFPVTAGAGQGTHGGGSQDAFATMIAFNNIAPVLSFSPDTGYIAAGVLPTTGTASTVLKYKVAYRDTDNTAPSAIVVCIDALPCSSMGVDSSAVSATLRDGNYANGEQYVYTTSLGAGTHTYFFTASDGTTIVDLPSASNLTGPTISSIDLAVSAFSTPSSSVGIGGAITLNDTVANTGSTVTKGSSSFKVQYYLSTDSVITSADIPIASRTIISLGAGASNSASTSWTVPTNIAPGVYRLGAIVDATNTQPETNEANNTRVAVATLTVVRNIDLTLNAFSTPSSSVGIGRSITLNDTVKNLGATATKQGSFTVQYYLSTDGVITTADTRIASRTITGLGAGGSNSAATSWTVPTSLAPGAYRLGAVVDSTNTQPETNETNNTRMAVASLTVVRNIDLTVSALSTPSTSVKIGGAITLNNTVANLGTTVTKQGSFNVQYYLSTDSVITTADTLIASRTITSLGYAASNSATISGTIPTSLAPGVYRLGAIVDTGNTQPETNETNNTRVAVATLTVVRNIDLTVSALSTPSVSVARGGAMTLNDTVANLGATVTKLGSFTVYYYLSTDSVITTADMRIASRAISSLGAGASNSAATSAIVPTILAPGVYRLGAIVDPSNTQPETNETNNTRVAVGTLTVQ
jgi:hypothetical protein